MQARLVIALQTTAGRPKMAAAPVATLKLIPEPAVTANSFRKPRTMPAVPIMRSATGISARENPPPESQERVDSCRTTGGVGPESVAFQKKGPGERLA